MRGRGQWYGGVGHTGTWDSIRKSGHSLSVTKAGVFPVHVDRCEAEASKAVHQVCGRKQKGS